MIAAIYAKKSTDQSNVADEAKSVSRQVENARAYAVKKGWTIDDRFIFVDDGISGAEFENRPGFVRLMASLGTFPARDRIGQWLTAGVIEHGWFTPTREGTPQGGVASPLMMNVHAMMYGSTRLGRSQ